LPTPFTQFGEHEPDAHSFGMSPMQKPPSEVCEHTPDWQLPEAQSDAFTHGWPPATLQVLLMQTIQLGHLSSAPQLQWLAAIPGFPQSRAVEA
jgi:hypothetical protein